MTLKTPKPRHMLTMLAAAALAVPATIAIGGPAHAAEGTPMDCTSIQAANTSSVTMLAGLLGITPGQMTPTVGINCIPALPKGAHNFCATNNNFSGLIVFGRPTATTTDPC